MTPCNLISQALRENKAKLPVLPYQPVEAICAVTGVTAPCLKRKDVLGKSFTNANLLNAPQSDYVSLDVYYSWFYGYRMSAEKKRDKRPEHMSSWFCSEDEFEELDRQGVREKVFIESMPNMWCGYATTSYKKHGSLLARVNTGKQRFWLFEERQVNCSNMGQVREWCNVLNVALRAGIGRSVMESLECPPFIIRNVGLKTWMEFQAWARNKYQTALYAFLCYLLPSQKELKDEIATY